MDRVVSTGRIAALSAAAALVFAAGAFASRAPAASPERPTVLPAVTDTAVFAGGCFWSMEKAFEHVPGVVEAVSGFSGGSVANPSYEDVGGGQTGHAESVRVVFDPARTSYQRLLDVYWHNIDPISPNGQFCDHGPEYRTIVFVRGPEQRRLAEASMVAVRRHFTRPVTTHIENAGPFYAAEAYHQNFAETHAAHYNAYRAACGRDRRLRELWGDAAGGQH